MTPADPNPMPVFASPHRRQRPAGIPTFLVALCSLALSACATFSDDPRVRTPGEQMDDEVLEKLVVREIRQSDPELRKSHLVASSYRGLVLLIGQVPSEELKLKAQSIAQGIAKVRTVHNEISVGGPISHVARTNDRWITAKVKSKLIAEPSVPGRKMKVQTENGVVYLIGILPREEADAAVQVASTVFGVQKIVRIFEYLD